jgi:hypothetical protein
MKIQEFSCFFDGKSFDGKNAGELKFKVNTKREIRLDEVPAKVAELLGEYIEGFEDKDALKKAIALEKKNAEQAARIEELLEKLAEAKEAPAKKTVIRKKKAE